MISVVSLPPFLADIPPPTLMGGSSPLFNWFVMFLLTLTLEMPMVLAAWRFRGCQGSLRVWLVTCFVGNLISHPLVTIAAVAVGLPGHGFSAMVNYVALETGVIAIEAWAFRFRATTSWTEAVVMSFAANTVTAVVGAYLTFFVQ